MTASEHMPSPTGWIPEMTDIDQHIRPLVVALRVAAINTIWSCGGGNGHLLRYPFIVAHASLLQGTGSESLARFYALVHLEQQRVQMIMRQFGVARYWLSMSYDVSCVGAHWILQLPDFGEFLAWPAPYNPIMQMPSRARARRQQRGPTVDLRFWSLRVAAEIGHRALCTFPFPGLHVAPLVAWPDTLP